MSSFSDTLATHPSMIEALRNTLQYLEANEELDSSDRAFVELRSSIMRAIAELELKKREQPAFR